MPPACCPPWRTRSGRRKYWANRVTPVEQHIHSVLEMTPVMATGFLAVLYWDQVRALLGAGPGRPDFALRRKRRDPLSPRSKLLLLGAMGLLGGLPYAEEMLRCLRRRPTVKPQPEANLNGEGGSGIDV